jgi:hypothetical protein
MIGKWAPDRFRSLVIGGEDPYPPSQAPADHSIPQHKRVQGLPDAPNPILELMKEGGDAWVRHREANMDLTPAMKARYRENDFEALLALWQTPYRWGAQIVPILPHFPISSLLYGGEAEDVFFTMKKAASAMPAATFVSLPDTPRRYLGRERGDRPARQAIPGYAPHRLISERREVVLQELA